MPDYSGIIHTIETAVYGRDMRQAIANGFRLCQTNEGGGGGAVNIDKTLTLPDYAADAKVVGDKFTELESTIASIEPGLSRAEKDAILAYFAEQVEIHPSLNDAYQVIYNLWNVAVSSVSLNTSSLSLAVGMSSTLKATVLPENAYDKTVVWSVEPDGIVSVAQNGTVLALTEGTATVTATCGGKSDSCTVHVEEINYYNVTKNFTGNVTINNDSTSVIEGYSYSAILGVPSGYELQDVVVKMGNADITQTAYTSSTKTIYISNVNGDIEISATSVMINVYSVSYNLRGVTANPRTESVREGSSYSTTLNVTNSSEYQFGTITVMMGSSDISETAIITSNPTNTAVISIANVTGNISITANVIQKIGELNDCSWSQISSISASGQAANYFSVGDTKTIHLSGRVPQGGTGNFDTFDTDVDVFILGFDHNPSVEGNNKITFCIGKKNGKLVSLATTGCNKNIASTSGTSYQCQFCMWPTELLAITWIDCTMRKFTLSNADGYGPSNPRPYSLMGALPSDLRAVMKATTKYSRNRKADSDTGLTKNECEAHSDYLFLVSEAEVRAVVMPYTEVDQGYETRYDYFKSGNGFNPTVMMPNGSLNTSMFPSGKSAIWTRTAMFVSTTYDATQNRAYNLIQGDSAWQWTDQRYPMPIMCAFCV